MSYVPVPIYGAKTSEMKSKVRFLKWPKWWVYMTLILITSNITKNPATRSEALSILICWVLGTIDFQINIQNATTKQIRKTKSKKSSTMLKVYLF